MDINKKIELHNTLTNQKETFTPIKKGEVKMYNCGPTVYGVQHIGNLSMFVFTDVLRRTMEYFGYKVDQVINITDFGHLVSDGDEGEDKMTKGLKAEGLEINMANMKVLAKKYADIFLNDLERLNIEKKKIKFPFASDYIEQQKQLIERLEEKGFTYKTSDGIYFNTSKFPDYGKLGNIKYGDESRINENKEKKSQKDFALWKFDQKLGWGSKWGQGFPGWHIECTAMIFDILGEQIDIHTGGIEHIGVHHNNEIAQAEAASGLTPFSQFWLHREHLLMNENKIAKSTGNTLLLSDLTEKGIHPMSFRYSLLTAHYRTPANFTLEAVEGAQNALQKIIIRYAENPDKNSVVISERNTAKPTEFLSGFEAAISDDLNTPVAIALLQEARSKEEIEKMDEVLGLNIKELAKELEKIPKEIKKLEKEREEARNNEDWKKSDELREKIEELGFLVKDMPAGTKGTRVQNTLTNLAKNS